METRPKIMFVAGEVSGDIHAARLLRALKSRLPELEAFGIGGDELEKAGVDLSYHVREMAVMGFSEVVRRFLFFRRVFQETVDMARRKRPDIVLLVDYPAFNLRLAEKLHSAGITIVYFVCPQVWAWNRSRIQQMARSITRLITIFPFEKEFFKDTRLKVDFVGHPLVDEAAPIWKNPPVHLPWTGQPRIALLPGSRDQEIVRILPAMWRAATRIEKRYPDASFLIAAPSSHTKHLLQRVVEGLESGPRNCEIVTGKTRHVLRQARAAMIASGTATIEASLMQCPMVIVYKTALLTYLLGRALVQVPHIGMVNIVAGKKICPEFIQGDATGEKLASAMFPLLKDDPAHDHMVAELKSVNEKLGQGGAAERAAELVIESLQNARL